LVVRTFYLCSIPS